MTNHDAATVCFNWTSPVIWPHAVPDIARLWTTADPAAVTCSSCRWTLASQQHDPPQTSKSESAWHVVANTDERKARFHA